MASADSVAANIFRVRQQIAHYCERYQRLMTEVGLLAVSKGQPAHKIVAAYHAGQHAFGENYLQEALAKIAALQDLPLEWHYLGAIQTNKTKKIAASFAWVHTVDKLSSAARLHRQRPPHLPPLNICLQVNISADPAKAGCPASDVGALAQQCQAFDRLRLRGLMTVPSAQESLLAQRHELRKMQDLWQKLREEQPGFDTLSMGMSADLEAAIAEGSTMLRIGTKIFGARN